MKTAAKVYLPLLLIFFASCNGKRDAALRQLYLDGVDYLRDTRSALEKTHNVTDSISVIENSLPRLAKLVERKKMLEKEYPEIRDTENREKIHANFAEFLMLRAEFQEFMAYGRQLLEKYHGNERFESAVRKGLNLMNYF